MVKYHILALLAASLLSRSLFAAAPMLGPEVPLVPGMDVRPAAYGRGSPAAASNGADHLVVWSDGRRLSGELYGTRVGTDGRPAEPLGRRIATGSNPRLASAGGDYVLVWQTFSGLRSMRLDADGAPLSAPHTLGTGYAVALVSNGSTYLLITRSFSNKPDSATILDRDGAPLRSVTETFTKTVGVATYGGVYYLVELGSPIAIRSITQDGAVTHRPLPTLSDPLGYQMTAAFAPGAILLTLNTGRYMLVDYEGRVLKQPASIPLPDTLSGNVAAAWDGREFLTVFSLTGNLGSVHLTTAFRLSASGTLIGEPLTPSKTFVNEVAFSSSEAGQLMVWSDSRDRAYVIVARAAPSFSTLTSEPTPATILTYSGEVQGDVQIARGPRGILTVWGDTDRRLKVSASFNGGPPVTLQSASSSDFYGDYIGWPSVMAGEHVFLVVWRHAALNAPGSDRLLAKRFDFDGKDLDPEPLVLLSQEAATYTELQDRPPHKPSIAFDGSSFLVAWVDKIDLFTIRVGEAGPLLNDECTHVSQLREAHSPRALWNGTDYVVSYTVDTFCPNNLYCIPRLLFPSRFARTGILLGELPLPIFNLEGDPHFAAALAPGRMSFAWSDYLNIRVAQATQDGRPLIAPKMVVPRAPLTAARSVEIAWTGSEFVVVWQERIADSTYKLMAIRLDIDLQPIDSAPFEVSAGPNLEEPAFLITTPSGVLIVYNRPDDTNAGAPRAFMRALDRTPRVPHRRAVR